MSNENLDELFKAQAKEAEKLEAERQAKKSKGSFTYEQVKWTGLEKGKMKILRFLGEHPDFNLPGQDKTPMSRQPYDARVVRLAKIRDDKGKTMKMVLPLRNRDETHLLWRIIDAVTKVNWIQDPNNPKEHIKSFPVKEAHPDIYNIIMQSGLPDSSPQVKFNLEGYGWAGRDLFIANCIDRGMKDWHEKEKHTVLLSKNINVRKNADGSESEFVDDGVPAFGFVQGLNSQILKYYGFWENYDIGLEKTGIQTNPTNIICANKNPEKVPEDVRDLIVEGGLTDSERAYERYNLDKIYGVTSFTKLWNRLHVTIEMIDAKLGTTFLSDLKKLSDDEAVKNAQSEEPEMEHSEVEEVSESTENEVFELSALPGWSRLKMEEKSAIVGIETIATENTPFIIKYKDTFKRMGKCPECSTKSPESFSICPGCGLVFNPTF